MRADTRRKLDRLLTAIKDGKSQKEIKDLYFNRTIKKLTDFIHKMILDSSVTKDEKKLLNKLLEPVSKKEEKLEIVKQDKVLVKALQVLESHEKKIKFFESYEERIKVLESKLKAQNQKVTEPVIKDHLIINEEIKNLKSDIRSIRINKELMAEFNEVADEYPRYSKTNLINMAIKEFVDKYK